MDTEYSDCTGLNVEIGSATDQIGAYLDEGGEGAVYRLQDTDEYVAKILKPRKRVDKRRKLEQMVGDSLIAPADQDGTVPWTAWPLETVSRLDDGSFVGYAMPYIDTSEYIDAQRYASQELRWGKSSRREQYKPALNLTLTVHWLHQNGYAVGDLSEQNVRVNSGTVTLIDCDSYAMANTEFSGSMQATRYTPAEGRGESYEEVKQTDQFGVAVHIFQFLMAGFHPYQAVGEDAVEGPWHKKIRNGNFPYSGSESVELVPPPHAPEFDRLPETIRRKFEQCFVEGRRNPGPRPSLQDWLAALSEASEFEVAGVESSGTEHEVDRGVDVNENTRTRNSDWHREIRQDYTNSETPSTATGPDTESQTAATAGGGSATTTETRESSSDSGTHWADEIRGDEAESDDTTDSPTPDQQSDETLSGVALLLVLLVLGFLVLLFLL